MYFFILFFCFFYGVCLTRLFYFILVYSYNSIVNKSPTLFIIRGLPGSGKAVWIDDYLIDNRIEKNYKICSVYDYYLQNDGISYQIDRKTLPQAYNRCYYDFLKGLNKKYAFIFINNPNCQKWEYQNYIYLAKQKGYRVKIIEIKCRDYGDLEYFQDRNNLGLSLSTCLSMYHKWETDNKAQLIDAYESDYEGDCLPFPKKSKKELDIQLDKYWLEKNN